MHSDRDSGVVHRHPVSVPRLEPVGRRAGELVRRPQVEGTPGGANRSRCGTPPRSSPVPLQPFIGVPAPPGWEAPSHLTLFGHGRRPRRMGEHGPACSSQWQPDRQLLQVADLLHHRRRDRRRVPEPLLGQRMPVHVRPPAGSIPERPEPAPGWT